MSATPTILFAGGGTGGHIFPNLAVIERLREQAIEFTAHLIISHRPIDRQIAANHRLDYTAIPARPLALHPMRLPLSGAGYLRGRRIVRRLIRLHHAAAIVGTGGFVTGPALAAGAAAGVPTAMVNLDAVPGRANRLMARKANVVFTAHPTPAFAPLQRAGIGRVQRVGVPLRPAVLQQTEPGEARRMLGLDAARPTLLITAGSQGATSINRLMRRLCEDRPTVAALAGWQVLHQSGEHEPEALRDAYARAGLPARVQPFIDDMGLAWSAATLAISRAGAGSVAEAWARAVPAIFLPYPYHRDQHQRLNARPLAEVGGARLVTDRVEPDANAGALGPVLIELLGDQPKRDAMRHTLQRTAPQDGGAAIAQWLIGILDRTWG